MSSSKPRRVIPKGSMVYNEWGELVDPADLRADPASKELDAKGMLRLILLNWHYRVSPSSFLSDLNTLRRALP